MRFSRPTRSSRVRRATLACGALSGILALACSSAPPTGIVFTASSLLRFDGAAHVVVKVFDEAETQVFCKDYPVDETTKPGASISLVTTASNLTIAPGAPDESGRVRVVTELFFGAAGAVGDGCDSSGSAPDIRKVAVLRYALEKTLPLRSVFELSCLGVLECDARTESCRDGACVDAATESASGSVVASDACFDLRACPSLVRAMPLAGRCQFAVPVDTTRGYVAVAFSFPSNDSSEAPVRGAAVLRPDEVALLEGNVVELQGRACSLVDTGVVTDVYFGYACNAPENDRPICPTGLSAGERSSALDAIVVGQGNGPRDASVSDTTSPRDGSDAAQPSDAADATLPPADGSDSAPPDDASGDATSGSDASDASDLDGPGSTSHVECPSASCPVPAQVCCTDGNPTTATCGPTLAQCTAGRYACDDQGDCRIGEVCCQSSSSGSSCLFAQTCAENIGTVLCSDDDARCPAGSRCETTGTAPPARRSCVAGSNAVDCGSLRCSVPSSICCAAFPPSCELGTCGTPISCDDASDCGGGQHCCFATMPGIASFCSANPCNMGLQTLCSDDDTSCPSGTTCSGPIPRDWARRVCL